MRSATGFIFASCTLLLIALAADRPGFAQANPHIVETDPLTPAEQLKKFHLPPGFEIELVASEPQIAKPLNLNFDARGRLLVTQTLEYPFPVGENERGRDAVTALEDRDRDGKYETVETHIGGLNIPIGLTQVKDATVVFSIPHIYSFQRRGRDTVRKKLYGPFGLEDTHGLNNGFTRWLDGWVYACHGFRNTSEVVGSDGNRVSMNSGNTYRFRADGSRIEHWTHGQVNPFGLCFDPLGNMYTADCHSKPMYQLLRGAYYPSFGKPHDGLGFGPTLIEHSHGSTGIGGIAYYAATHFPPAYRDTIFVANPITHRINHDKLQTFGSTYRGVEQPDFLRCDDRWFRPVDLQVGPDGALYVADFYNCIIGHYEVPLDHPKRDRHRGRIWRIVYKGTKETPAALAKVTDLTGEDLPHLWQRLGEENLTVRTLATHEIVDRIGERARKSISTWIDEKSSPAQRTHGMWVLERTGGVEPERIASLAADKSRLVRVHVMKLLAERPRWRRETAILVRSALADTDPFVRRAAADAIARHPSPENVDPLLTLWRISPPTDTHLIHVTRMALRDQLVALREFADVNKRFVNVDSMRRLLDVCLGVRNDKSAALVMSGLISGKDDPARRPAMLHHVVRYAAADKYDAFVSKLIATAPKDPRQQTEWLLTIARAVQERGSKLPPAARTSAVKLATNLLAGDKQESTAQGLRLVADFRLNELHVRVKQIAANRSQADGLRIAALDACQATDPPSTFALLEQTLADPKERAALKRKAMDLLSAINSNKSRSLLTAQFKTAPRQLAIEIALRLARTPRGGETLLASVAEGKASPRLLQERNVQRTMNAARVPNWKDRVARLTAGLPPADARINQLIARHKAGFLQSKRDVKLGAALFKKHCAACHQIGSEGQKVGPQLDGIGNRGLDRLLEDVLDPSRNLDPAFRTSVLETADGKVLSGLVTGQEGQVLVLVDRDGKPQRIPLADVEKRTLSPLSPMPGNVTELVKGNDFYHLLSYLLRQRQVAESSKP